MPELCVRLKTGTTFLGTEVQTGSHKWGTSKVRA